MGGRGGGALGQLVHGGSGGSLIRLGGTGEKVVKVNVDAYSTPRGGLVWRLQQRKPTTHYLTI